MADGRVLIGFSEPWAAAYAVSGGAIVYSDAMKLGRGVSVSLEMEDSSDTTDFYADNVLAESIAGTFTGGTLTLTVDGMKDNARKFLLGLSTVSATWYSFDDDQQIPDVGVGFICKYISAGVESYVPVVLAKCKFKNPGLDAETQGETPDFQTEELEASVMRGDDAKHTWKYLGEEASTEAAALTKLKAKLGVS